MWRIDVLELGDPDWTTHLNHFQNIVLLAVIDEMASHNCPLDEEAVYEIAQELAEVCLLLYIAYRYYKCMLACSFTFYFVIRFSGLLCNIWQTPTFPFE